MSNKKKRYKNKLYKIDNELPKTFYAGQSLEMRVRHMVDIYNRAIKAYYVLDRENEQLLIENYNLKQQIELCSRIKF
jgi:hypothetical protein